MDVGVINRKPLGFFAWRTSTNLISVKHKYLDVEKMLSNMESLVKKNIFDVIILEYKTVTLVDNVM